MKLWDSLTACLILLSALRASPLPRGAQRSPFTVRKKGRVAESPLEPPPVQNRMSVTAGGVSQSESVCRQGGETGSWRNMLAPAVWHWCQKNIYTRIRLHQLFLLNLDYVIPQIHHSLYIDCVCSRHKYCRGY